jgi:hypothetical protein
MFANMLDAPVPELAMSDDINVCQNFLDTRALRLCQRSQASGGNRYTHLVFFETILKDILDDKATSFA